MEKIWLKHYPLGVPAEINPDRYPCINTLFDEICEKFAKRAAFVNLNTKMTYQALQGYSKAFAAYCQHTLGLEKGDRVALMMPNILQYPVALFGILQAGFVVVNVNPLYTPRELEHQLKDSGCKAIVVLANFAHTLADVLEHLPLQHIIITEIADLVSFPKSYFINWFIKKVKKMIPKYTIPGAIPFMRILKEGQQCQFQKPVIRGEDLAFLQYTGGTTGVAKGAILTHRNMVANIEQAYAWIKPSITLGEEIIITALPLYHIFSLLANCLTFMRAGALNVLITNPRDIKGFIRILSRHRFTVITGVNTLFNALLNHPSMSKLNFTSLKITLGGGMAVQQSVALKWQKVTGVVLTAAYGLTEASPGVCVNPLNLRDFNGSIGLPLSSTLVSIRDEAGEELKVNEVGELWVQGPQVMRGYWQNPKETAFVIQDGWLKTGDIASINEQGFVKIVDRKKDLIIVSGFKVYPNEVEEVIALLPGVLEVAVVGVMMEGVEEVKAFIVKRDPMLTKEAILQHCHAQLTGYKVPKEIEFRKELPKSNVGKILRRVLREESLS